MVTGRKKKLYGIDVQEEEKCLPSASQVEGKMLSVGLWAYLGSQARLQVRVWWSAGPELHMMTSEQLLARALKRGGLAGLVAQHGESQLR